MSVREGKEKEYEIENKKMTSFFNFIHWELGVVLLVMLLLLYTTANMFLQNRGMTRLNVFAWSVCCKIHSTTG